MVGGGVKIRGGMGGSGMKKKMVRVGVGEPKYIGCVYEIVK